MKVVISSRGESLASDMDDRFGRAEYFAVFDTENGAFSAVSNQKNLNAAQDTECGKCCCVPAVLRNGGKGF